MKVRVHIEDDRRCTVHESPSLLARIFLLSQDRDYPAYLAAYPNGASAWLNEHDNREVPPCVAAAIELAVALKNRDDVARDGFLRLIRGGK